MNKETYTERMLKDIAEKQNITNGKLDALNRKIVDDQDGDTYRYNALFCGDGYSGKITYVIAPPAIEEVRDAINKLREDLLKPRLPGAFGVARPLVAEWSPKAMRCSDPQCPLCNTSGIAPAPPKEPKLSEIFAQFMAESYLTRTRVSYFADHGAYAIALRDNLAEQYIESIAKYDIPAFLELLRKTPKECIL